MNLLYYGDNLDDAAAGTSPTSPWTSSTSTRRSTRTPTTTCCSRSRTARRAAAQIKAFEDTWHWDEAAAARLRGGRRGRRKVSRGDAGVPHVPGRQRHDGLPGHDGAAARGAAPRPQADRQHLPPLRPDREPLPEDAHGCRLRAAELPERDRVAAHGVTTTPPGGTARSTTSSSSTRNPTASPGTASATVHAWGMSARRSCKTADDRPDELLRQRPDGIRHGGTERVRQAVARLRRRPSANRHWAIPGIIADGTTARAVADAGTLGELEYLNQNGFIYITLGEEWPRYQRRSGPEDGQPMSGHLGLSALHRSHCLRNRSWDR